MFDETVFIMLLGFAVVGCGWILKFDETVLIILLGLEVVGIGFTVD
jgi:hypothetical protein